MAKILIVKCSADDDDGEMAKMAASIEAFKKNQNDIVSLVDLTEITPRHLTNEYKNYDKLIVTGHSRFFENGSRFVAPPKYVCRPLAQRLVGGVPADQIASFLADIVKLAKIKDILFCCCEIATNVDTHTRDDNGEELPPAIDVRSNWDNIVDAYLKSEKGDEKVSLLVWLGILMRQKLRKQAWAGEVLLGGLNGIGYIVEDNPKFLTFSQEYFSNYATILKRQNKSKTLKKDDEFLNNYVLNKARKASAHVLTYKFLVP